MTDVSLSTVKKGGGATKFIYNRFTVAGYNGSGAIQDPNIARASLSGALTANTLVDLLNESGSAGQIDQFSIASVDATARTLRVVITVDGTQILDVTSASFSAANSGGLWAGISNASIALQLPPIKYTNSIRLQYASNLTETAKFNLYLAYQKVT